MYLTLKFYTYSNPILDNNFQSIAKFIVILFIYPFIVIELSVYNISRFINAANHKHKLENIINYAEKKVVFHNTIR